ncbi:MAG TPA: hypothetical protein VL500_06825 [Candidatus Eisenbacteria bacterium]|nr:hypothetical protein [Candidatus Eisenbacteria bacterium]
MKKIPLHPEDTPYTAYARLMRHRAYALAATVARDYGLGRDLLILALDGAMSRFEELGFPELSTAFAEQMGFTVVSVGLDELAQKLRELDVADDLALPTLRPQEHRPN